MVSSTSEESDGEEDEMEFEGDKLPSYRDLILQRQPW